MEYTHTHAHTHCNVRSLCGSVTRGFKKLFIIFNLLVTSRNVFVLIYTRALGILGIKYLPACASKLYSRRTCSGLYTYYVVRRRV